MEEGQIVLLPKEASDLDSSFSSHIRAQLSYVDWLCSIVRHLTRQLVSGFRLSIFSRLAVTPFDWFPTVGDDVNTTLTLTLGTRVQPSHNTDTMTRGLNQRKLRDIPLPVFQDGTTRSKATERFVAKLLIHTPIHVQHAYWLWSLSYHSLAMYGCNMVILTYGESWDLCSLVPE